MFLGLDLSLSLFFSFFLRWLEAGASPADGAVATQVLMALQSLDLRSLPLFFSRLGAGALDLSFILHLF